MISSLSTQLDKKEYPKSIPPRLWMKNTQLSNGTLTFQKKMVLVASMTAL